MHIAHRSKFPSSASSPSITDCVKILTGPTPVSGKIYALSFGTRSFENVEFALKVILEVPRKSQTCRFCFMRCELTDTVQIPARFTAAARAPFSQKATAHSPIGVYKWTTSNRSGDRGGTGQFANEQIYTGLQSSHGDPLPLDRLKDRHDWKYYLPANYVCRQ